MALSDFLAEVSAIVNESEDIDPLIAAAAKRANAWIERQHSFQQMRETGYYQFPSVTGEVTVVRDINVFGGPTDTQISNTSVDGRITVTSVASPFYSLLAVGDYVRFYNLSGGFAPLHGTYGQVESITLAVIGGSVVIAVPDDASIMLGSQFQPITFIIQKMSGNPYLTDAPTDPGLLPIGPRLKRIIGPIQLCSHLDRRQVLRRVQRIYTSDTWVEDEIWTSVTEGSLPGGYRQLGVASKIAEGLVGATAFSPNDWVLQFRPIPDHNYFAFIESFRFSLWPTDPSSDHWMIDGYGGLLLARTMYELAPALKDTTLAQVYAERLPVELDSAKRSDVELEESDANDDMAYDPDFLADR